MWSGQMNQALISHICVVEHDAGQPVQIRQVRQLVVLDAAAGQIYGDQAIQLGHIAEHGLIDWDCAEVDAGDVFGVGLGDHQGAALFQG